MVDDELKEGLPELEQLLHDWHTGAESTPGRLRRQRLRADGSVWMPCLTALDEAMTIERMLVAVRAVQLQTVEQGRGAE